MLLILIAISKEPQDFETEVETQLKEKIKERSDEQVRNTQFPLVRLSYAKLGA
jgi:hypothetical protein